MERIFVTPNKDKTIYISTIFIYKHVQKLQVFKPADERPPGEQVTLGGFDEFQKVLAGEEGMFFGQGVPGLFHVLDNLFSRNQVVL